MLKSSPRRLAFGVASVAVALALASTAYACTTYRGYFTIKGYNQPSSTAVGANGTNPNGGMRYCNDIVPAQAKVPKAYITDFTATVGPASSCLVNGVNKLRPSSVLGTYDINYQAGTAYYGDCMSGSSNITRLGGMTVDSNGNGSGSYNLVSSSTPLGAGDLCISDRAAYDGNQMPIEVI